MATVITLQSSDLITNSRADINTSLQNLNSDKIETSVLDTDTTLAANSDSKVATQKAVKAYIDSGGNTNASETDRGVVEEATDAEVAAGTATGATGAKLFITPTKLAASRYSPTKSLAYGATINGATLPVPVYQNKTDNEVYACDANDTAATKFIGFAVSNSTDGVAGNVQFGGVVAGFSALDEGEKYYVQDTIGTIGTSPGTLEILVGVAISATELLVQKGQRRAIGKGTWVDAGNNSQNQTSAITLGFRPTLIRMTAFNSGRADLYQSTGYWNNGVYALIRSAIDESGGNAAVAGEADAIIRITDAAAAGMWSVTITSVTDTGFTISATQNQDTPDTTHYVWEAVGEL